MIRTPLPMNAARMLLCLLLFGLGNPLRSAAQADTAAAPSAKGRGGWTSSYFFTFPVERPLVKYPDLDRELVRAGLPECKLPVASIGLGIQLQEGPVIGMVAYNKTTRRPKSDTVALEVFYRALSFGVGYDLLRHPKWSLYPCAGIKFCKINYRYAQKVADTPSVGTYLQSRLDYKELTNTLTTFDLGIGISHQWFYLVSLRAGVLLPMGDGKWSINRNKVTPGNAPGIQYQGYITLTLGLGTLTAAPLQRRTADTDGQHRLTCR